MSANQQPDDPAGSTSARHVRRLLAISLTLAAVAGVVFGISRLGEEARRGIGSQGRYAVRFADVQCDSPPGLERAAFLSEVRYVANFPETFQSLDPDLNAKLTAAFAQHPWVANVETVSVSPEGIVQVKLRFRVPALAVHSPDGGRRLVDATGVVLPPEASADGVAELANPVLTPIPIAGQAWADADVKRALELVDAHQPRRLEKTPTGWRLTTADAKTLVVER